MTELHIQKCTIEDLREVVREELARQEGQSFGDPVLTIAKVAEEFGVEERTVRSWIDKGWLKAHKVGGIGRNVYIKRSAVDAALEDIN